jgi:hypothetical protein
VDSDATIGFTWLVSIACYSTTTLDSLDLLDLLHRFTVPWSGQREELLEHIEDMVNG